jgi:hypothetical protein
MGTTNADSFLDRKSCDEKMLSATRMVSGTGSPVKLVVEFEVAETLSVSLLIRLAYKKRGFSPFRQKFPVRVFLRNLFFLAVPNVALFPPLSMNRLSAIFNDRSFPDLFVRESWGSCGFPGESRLSQCVNRRRLTFMKRSQRDAKVLINEQSRQHRGMLWDPALQYGYCFR